MTKLKGVSCGVYLIKNIATESFYIGKATGFESRWRGHQSALSRGKGSPLLQSDWFLWGHNCFKFSPIQTIAFLPRGHSLPHRTLDLWESAWILATGSDLNAHWPTLNELVSVANIWLGRNGSLPKCVLDVFIQSSGLPSEMFLKPFSCNRVDCGEYLAPSLGCSFTEAKSLLLEDR